MADLRIAKVEKVHPEANSADLIMVDTLERIPLVQCMGDMTSNSGTADLHEPTAFTQGDITPTKDRDVYVVVGFVGRVPIVLGGLAPQVSQLCFKGRPNFRVRRHPSDVYDTLEDDGAFTMAWPNGTYIKVGADNALEDLSGRDFDQKWVIARNTNVAPKIRLMVKDDAGVQKALVDIDAATGDIAITTAGDLSATVAGDATVAVTGDITSSAANWTHTGDVEVDGTLHVTHDVTVDQTVTATTDVVGGGKHLKTHTHGGVQTGGGTTGPPS